MRLIEANTQPDTDYGVSVLPGDEVTEHEHDLMQVGSEHRYRHDNQAYEALAVMECSDVSCKHQEVQTWDEKRHTDEVVIPRDNNGAHVR